jgi:hypothetical protein
MENVIEASEKLSLIGGVAWCPLNQEGWAMRPPRALRENMRRLSPRKRGGTEQRAENLRATREPL